VGGSEKEVADFVFDPVRRSPGGHFRLDLSDFLVDLGDHRVRVGPIEADAGRTFRDLGGAEQGRVGEGDAVEHAAPGPALGRLMDLPRLVLRRDGGDHRVTEYMRMPAYHLVDYGIYDVVKGECTVFLGHAGMED